MTRTIAIIAPFIDNSQFNMDFTLRLRSNNRELTLSALYELAKADFKVENVSRGTDYGQDVPAAGFYLEGLLHQSGYDTILTNKFDKKTIDLLAEKDPFCVCISTTMIIATELLLELISLIRSIMPDVPVIAGGVFIWKQYQHYLRHLTSPVLYPLERWMLFHADHIPNLCLTTSKGFNFTRREEEIVDYNEDYTRWDLINEIPEKIPLRTSVGRNQNPS
jgi:hypothetical protein